MLDFLWVYQIFSLERLVTAELYLSIWNPFESDPRDGWRFALQCTALAHTEFVGPRGRVLPASPMIANNPDQLEAFEKRLYQKFEARWMRISTVYPRTGHIDIQ